MVFRRRLGNPRRRGSSLTKVGDNLIQEAVPTKPARLGLSDGPRLVGERREGTGDEPVVTSRSDVPAQIWPIDAGAQ